MEILHTYVWKNRSKMIEKNIKLSSSSKKERERINNDYWENIFGQQERKKVLNYRRNICKTSYIHWQQCMHKGGEKKY
jgi:hypothetical protein